MPQGCLLQGFQVCKGLHLSPLFQSSYRLQPVVLSPQDPFREALLNQVHRGATKLYAQGAYGGENENVVLCCVRRNESAQVTSVIKKIDPNAFTISFEAGEIRGKGFKIY